MVFLQGELPLSDDTPKPQSQPQPETITPAPKPATHGAMFGGDDSEDEDDIKSESQTETKELVSTCFYSVIFHHFIIVL